MSGSVVVTDAEERAVLGACRGLTSAGYRVCAVARLRPAATHWSRACSERVTLPDPRISVDRFVEGLEELLRRRPYDVLIPGSDASLSVISEHRERLEPWTRLGLPSRDTVRRSVDKLALLEAAAEAGLAAPTSRGCAGLEEAREAAAELGFPVVVKPAQSFTAVNGGLRQQGVVVAADDAALAAAVPALAAPFVVQRFERAQFVSCTGVVADGRLLALTTSRVARLWPPGAGMHAFAETVAAPDGFGGPRPHAARLARLAGDLPAAAARAGRRPAGRDRPQSAGLRLDRARRRCRREPRGRLVRLAARPRSCSGDGAPGPPLPLGGGRPLQLRLAAPAPAAAGGGRRVAPPPPGDARLVPRHRSGAAARARASTSHSASRRPGARHEREPRHGGADLESERLLSPPLLERGRGRSPRPGTGSVGSCSVAACS